MREKIKLLLLIVIIPFCLQGKDIPESLKVKELKLENGLTVYLNEDHNQPNVMGLVVIRGGSKRDPKNATGIAHYFEHIMFKGSENLGTINYKEEKVYLDSIELLYDQLAQSNDEDQKEKIQLHINDLSIKAAEYAIPNELDKVLANMGGTGVNAYTNMESIVYHNVFPGNQLEKWMEVYYDRFANPVFRLFQSELETVYEEKNMSMDDPFNRLFEDIMKNIYRNHPYGQQTVLGSIEHLKTPSLSKMKDYYNTFYVPNNMAVILCGDFNSDVALDLIKKTFGQMEYKEVPPMTEYKEEAFNGRELVSKRLTPIKVGVIAYRAVESNHQDAEALIATNRILSNYSSTGLLDQLVLQNKLMEVYAMDELSVDNGVNLVLYLPKIIGQSLKNAEKLINDEIEKLKKGEFSDELLASVKQSMIKNHYESLENTDYRSYFITDAFLNNITWDEYLKYPEKVESITKEEVVMIANKYYTDNRLVFYSKMGFPKKHKLEKPPYKPVTPKNTEAKSEFAMKIENMPTIQTEPSFIKFNEDVYISEIQDKVHLYTSKNNINDIFSLRLQYGIGKFNNPTSEATSYLLNYCGAGDLNTKEFKEKMQKLGLSFYASVDFDNFTIYFSGLENNFDESIELINTLLTNPKATQDDVDKVAQSIKFNERYDEKDPYSMGRALSHYAMFGEKSTYIYRKTSKEVKKMNIADLLKNFQEIQDYEVDVHYCGKLESDEAEKIIKKIQFKENLKSSKVYERPELVKRNENTILLVNDSKAIQSQIYFIVNGENIDENSRTMSIAFNKYFGDDMNSIVFQEIREFRSLGYSAWGNYFTPLKNDKPGYLKGFVSTQSDKTMEAIEAFSNLILNMPEKEERLDIVKNSLTQSVNSERPTFRDLTFTVANWDKQGYKHDPRKTRIDKYNTMKFSDITNFYKNQIKDKPYIITIVGDAKRINLDELKKYGKIIELDKKDIYKL